MVQPGQHSNHHITVGLLGGSFNPAHAGHLHLSEFARKWLELSQIWWLVSPSNPLKASMDMASFEERMKSAEIVAKENPFIHVSDIEQKLGTIYTIDTLNALKRRFPKVRFAWLMGADNLQQFHRWKSWREIFHSVPVAVFDRAPYSHNVLRGQAAIAFNHRRVQESRSTTLKHMAAPAWSFIHMSRYSLSSTEIRENSPYSAT